MGCVMKIAVPSYWVRPGHASVLEWNLPFRNPGSATVGARAGARYVIRRALKSSVRISRAEISGNFLD